MKDDWNFFRLDSDIETSSYTFLSIDLGIDTINSNRAGFFEGSFFWRGEVNLTPLPLQISRRAYLISIQLYTIVKNNLFKVC